MKCVLIVRRAAFPDEQHGYMQLYERGRERERERERESAREREAEIDRDEEKERVACMQLYERMHTNV